MPENDVAGQNRAVVEGLYPAAVWRSFAELSAIPRCSGEEKAVRNWIMSKADALGLEHRSDAAGNLVVYKPASAGWESVPTVVLQGHLDMVCEKNRGVQHDFRLDGIGLTRREDWIGAENTTLGADNGIAVAMMLAVLEDIDPSGPLECLFTVDEESGLTGAMELEPALVNGRILINLDSEEEGTFYIGCAGGCNTYLTLPVVREVTPRSELPVLRVSITGLRGGHSGADIHEERGNSIVLGARLIAMIRERHPSILPVDIRGGGKHNAIPREFALDVACTDPVASGPEELADTIAQAEALFRDELEGKDEHFSIRLEPGPEDSTSADARPAVLTPAAFQRVADLLLAIPQGVLGTSRVVPGMVETSTNLAAVTLEGDALKILTSQRSSRDSLVARAAEQVAAIGRLAGASPRFAERYPAWAPSASSPVRSVAEKVYRELFSTEPRVTAIHAGLECGVIGERLGGMDMISLGPDLEGAHTPEERLRISSTESTWNLLRGILREIGRAAGVSAARDEPGADGAAP